MQIRYIANSTPAARDAQAPGATASPMPSAEARRIKSDVDAARTTAMSALNNDRFRVMLEQISDPGASGALVTMGSDAGSTTDIKTALSRYAENSE
ncbi:hypothetical protein [Mesorhizobium sp. 131-2-1]|uniref:hypothetical protein n=1 Tax=Mesorhizobium sp. 131-2-1 TaxID=2744518 RepID=UPI0019251B5B|nr:hypothetical protein [Mesorhizobium sp. 131-2-1]